jgi:ABC-type Fe3+-hydroxamate transport system substrate-binding protein
MVYQDQLQRAVHLQSPPRRVVSLVPSQTELLVDLGLEYILVGVTKFCVHPDTIRKTKALVGGTKQIKISKVKELRPDLILCNKEENTKDLVASLSKIAPVHISDIYTLEDCFILIKMYGDLFEVQNKARELISEIVQQRKYFQQFLKGRHKRLKVAYFIWRSPYMVAASNTFINTMLYEAGFNNIFKSELRYPVIELNAESLKSVDAIFLSSEPYPFKKDHIIQMKKLFPQTTIQLVNGELFSWYGSRLKLSYDYFKQLHNLI